MVYIGLWIAVMGGFLAWWSLLKWHHRHVRHNALVVRVLAPSDFVAEEQLERPSDVERVQAALNAACHAIDIHEEGCPPASRADNSAAAPQEVVAPEKVRRIADKTRYMQALVMECKNRFGCPARSAANVLAVRRFLLDAMTKHGVRPTHIAQVLPLCVSLVFIQSDSELLGEEVLESLEALRRTGSGPWWYRMWSNLVSVTGRTAPSHQMV